MERSATSALTINAAMLDDAQSIAQSALTTVPELSHLLHPAMLDDLGLPAAIDWYLAGCGKRHGIRAELLHDGLDQRLVPEIETAVFRVVQEAMTNVATHADATAAVVRIVRVDDILRVTVEDAVSASIRHPPDAVLA
jgi:signal transduction histidine kinase